MQATVSSDASTEPFFQQTIGGRPFGLWCIWLMGIFAWLFIFFGIIINEVGYSEFFVEGQANNDNNDKFQCTCGYEIFNCLGSGFQDQKYEDNSDIAVILQQQQAGEGWLAFLILAMLFSTMCCFGFFKDYLDGEYDSAKPSDYWDGCPGPCQPCGFSSCGIIFTALFSFLGLMWYVVGEQCSTEEFWTQYVSNATDLVTIGGLTMALVVMGIILYVGILGLVFYMIRAFGFVPRGEKKQLGIQFQKEAVGDVPAPKPKPQPVPVAQPTGKPPSSAIFNPSNNVTSNPQAVNSSSNLNSSNSNLSANNTEETNPWKKKANMKKNNTGKPVGPPPVPSRPKGPPPVPKN